MDQDDRAVIGARHMVLRMLLTDLYEVACMRMPDPERYAADWGKAMLGAMDTTIDTSPMPDAFKHVALHEAETFWTGLQQAIARRVEYERNNPAE